MQLVKGRAAAFKRCFPNCYKAFVDPDFNPSLREITLPASWAPSPEVSLLQAEPAAMHLLAAPHCCAVAGCQDSVHNVGRDAGPHQLDRHAQRGGTRLAGAPWLHA